MEDMHDGDVAVPAPEADRYVAFEPLAGPPGVDIAGGYSRTLWRPRLGGAVWALWVAVGTRVGLSGPFECPVGGDILSTLGDEGVVERALVELSAHGLARRTGAGRWAVRTTCPVPVSSTPPTTKAGAVRHYEQLAAGARLQRWRRSHPAPVAGRASAQAAPGPAYGPAHGSGSVSEAGAGASGGAGAGLGVGLGEVIPLAGWRRHRRAEPTLAAGD